MPKKKADTNIFTDGYEILKSNYRKQKTMFDKAWYVLHCKAQERAAMEAKINGYAIAGDEYVDNENQAIDDLLVDFCDDLFGDGSVINVKRGFEALGIMGAQLAMEMGDEYQRVYDELKKQEDMMTEEERAKDPTITNDPKTADRFREMKAAYITHKAEGNHSNIAAAYTELISLNGLAEVISSNKRIRDKLWSAVGYNRDMTVSKYLDALNYTEAEKKAYYESENCKETDTMYSVYRTYEIKRREKNNEGGRVSSREIDEMVKRFFLDHVNTELLQQFINEGVEGVYENKRRTVHITDRKKFDNGSFALFGYKKLGGIEISAAGGDSPDREPDPTLKAQIKNDIKLFENWRITKGEKIIQSKMEKGKESYNKLTEIIYSGEQFNMKNNKNFAKIHYDEITGADTFFLRGMIRDLESTGTLGRKKNSDEYDRMLTALKDYEKEVSRNNPMAALEAKNKLRKAATKYMLKGKDKIRRDKGGQKRFDDSLLIMSELLPEKDFEKVIALVNKGRNAKPGDKAYIDYDKTYKNKNQKGGVRYNICINEKMRADEIQKNTLKDATGMYNRDAKKVAEFEKMFTTDKAFSPVGAYKDNIYLSNKDFAALAYVSMLTPEALAFDGRYSDLPFEEKLLKIGNDYTAKLYESGKAGKDTKLEDVKKSALEQTTKALSAYEMGDKEPLAKLIASGVRDLSKLSYNDVDLNGKKILNAEMSTRLINMLSRDPELSKLARENGLDNSVCKNYDTLRASADILNKSRFAFGKFDDYKVFEKPEKERVELMTDLLMPHSIMFCANQLPSVKGGEKLKDYNLIENLKKPEEMKEFREVVRKFVKKNNLQNTSASMVVNKYRDSQDFIRDLTAVTKNEAKRQVEKRAKRSAANAKTTGGKSKAAPQGRKATI